ncbi:acyltransferase [Porticoccaceae bacterium]|nr:acyltransferase [Porticoccaceae bacterium]
MKYRAEIDGLRAIAVIPVLLFHAGFELFSGGFVGVDVFFVISGYLITTILIEDLDKNRFSIVSFYERRARRILPALFFMMFLSVPFAWLLMLPDQLKSFSHSLAAVSLFSSNILFWSESDYFAAVAEQKPLLHTWSLAVEEQFYLLFPLFLMLAWRFGKNRVFVMIAIMSGISLLLSEWAWRNSEVANFYLMPTRVWELFFGSIAAFWVQSRGVYKCNILSLIGLSAIFYSIFAFNDATPFPSAWALIPVVGTVLIILFSADETLSTRLLGKKIFVGIGLISYSAYLWHQPLFAFAKISSINSPTPETMVLLCIVSLALAYVSWRYVETPFRNKKRISRRNIFSLSLLGILGFITLGYIGHINDGFEGRFSHDSIALIRTAEPSPNRSECHHSMEESSLMKAPCTYFGVNPSVAVLGNSHGVELSYSLARKLSELNISLEQYTISGCRHDYGLGDETATVCGRWHSKVLKELQDSDAIRTVIVSYRHEAYLEESRYLDGLIDITQKLVAAGKTVILVLQAPLPGAEIDNFIRLSINSELEDVVGLQRLEWGSLYKGKDRLLAMLSEKVLVVDPADLFCDTYSCLVVKDSRALYFDNNHMSLSGADLVAQEIMGKYFLDSVK